MGQQTVRADRFVQKIFGPKRTPAVTEQQQAIQTRADKLQVIAQRAIQRRKGF